MAIKTRQLFSAICLFLVGPVYAEGVTVFVDGRSGPWDISVNTTFSYGIVSGGVPDSHLGPTSVSGAAGLRFVTGDYLTIQYMSGLADAGGAHELSDANGRTWWIADDGAPGQYIPGTNYLEQLLGTFANASGSIVGSPFTIGNGPLSVAIPTGATQLLMGFNDGWYNDNGAGNLTMKITEVPAIPEPEIYAMMFAGLGLLGFTAQRRSHQVTTV
ncbi:PEP-CTERM protein-sorting domain-containing protein [Nitrosospira multiformis]|nr:PEP-CTERM protein-sorting domain-containing protein [Nitrosospira multiformis]